MTLLQVVQLPQKGVKGVPLFVEIPVHEDTAPYLVTAHKGPLWIGAPLRGGVVRSAMLRGAWQKDIFKTYYAMTMEVIRQGKERSWGNVFPNTPKGVKAAQEYLESFGLDMLETLDHDTHPRVNGVLHAKNTWIPEGSAVMVPRDRSYLGNVGVWDANTYTVVLHNPARGMAVLGDW